MPGIDPQISQKLSRAGLTAKESTVYAALLEAGGAFPSKVAEVTKLNRSTTYKVLESLSIKGLISELEKRNKLYYQIENPKSLERYAESRITSAKRELENTQDLLPALFGLYSLAPNKPVVRFFEGKEGVLRVYEDHILQKRPYEMLSFSNTADLIKFLPEGFRVKYIKKKQKIGITTRAILPDTQIDIDYNKTIYKGFSKEIWPEIKNIPRKLFAYEADITIYGENKVSIINFKQPQSAGTIIEDETIHNMMKMIFELAWNGVNLITK